MNLLLPPEIAEQLIRILKKAGRNETGGILMGEHIAENQFRIMEITAQYGGGAFAFFMRSLKDIIEPLNAFFRKTGFKYRRYNYIGEWHSHPSFKPIPSEADILSMFEIVCDKNVGAKFAVLLIVRLINTYEIEATASVFLTDMKLFKAEITMEEKS